MLELGVWIPALMSLHFTVHISVSRQGSETRTPGSVLVCECEIPSCALLSTCFVVFCVACSSLAACFHIVMFCVNTRLMSVLISYVFVSCLAQAHGLCFCFVWAQGFCLLWFHVACALMSIVLTPPILLPDYWFVWSTCPHLSSLVTCLIPHLNSDTYKHNVKI